MEKVKDAILKTLTYADVFDYPLREDELWRFLIGKKITYSQFTAGLQILLKQKQIGQLKNYYFLPNQAALIELRQKRYRFAKDKLRLAEKIARYIRYVPTVDLIGISGSLAMNNTDKEEDIDLFVVSAPQTLFITRVLVVVLLSILGVRRRPGDREVKNKICINMWLDGSRLKLPENERDLFVAHEIAQLKPLFSRNLIYERFLLANSWLKKYLPHIKIIKLKRRTLSKPVAVARICEKFLRHWQIKYMQKRRTTEKISSTLLKFHPQDARQLVLDEYKTRLAKYGIKP